MNDWMTVVVATFGDPYWLHAGDQAAATVPTGVPIIRVHERHGTIAGTRNAGLEKVTTEYVLWLDADDSLLPGYVHHMNKGTADIRQPAIKGWGFLIAPPKCIHHGDHHTVTRECLRYGNPLSMGAVVRTELAKAHPWDERWPVLEDFAFWRSILADPTVTVESLPAAVYQVRTRRNPGPRNRSVRRSEWEKIGHDIAATIPFN